MAEDKIGKVVHFYDKIGVAILALDQPLKVGDSIRIVHGQNQLTQTVGSLQKDHSDVEEVKPGDEVGLKVDQPVAEGSEIYLA